MVEFCGAFGIFGRYVKFFTGSVFVFETEHFHEKNVDECVEVGTCVDGELYDYGFYLGESFYAFEGGFPVCLFAVELVDDANERNVVFLGVARLYFTAHFETVLCVEQHETNVGYLECREQSAAEVVGTGGVYYVQLVVHELCIEYRGVYASAIGVFKVGVV